MKAPLRFLVLMMIGAAGLMATGSTAQAQSDRWNSLFDRIIRLEARVKTINRGGGGAGASSNVRLANMEAQLRQLIGQMQQMNFQMRAMQKELNRLRGRSGRLTPPPPVRRQTRLNPPRQPDIPANSFNTSGFAPANPEPDARFGGNNGTEIIVEMDRNGNRQPQVFGALPGTPRPALPPAGNGAGPVRLQNGAGGGSASLVPGRVETTSLGGTGGGANNGAGSAAPRARIGADDAVYQAAYGHLLRRRFGAAEAGFKTYLTRYRGGKKASDAQYWLGETYYAQGYYKKAAQSFLTGYKKYPRSRRAPGTLLKLGMSMRKLGQKAQACGVLGEVKRKYPKAKRTVKRARVEMKRARCG